jgi:hypothetical protein
MWVRRGRLPVTLIAKRMTRTGSRWPCPGLPGPGRAVLQREPAGDAVTGHRRVRRLADRELGELAADDPGTRELRRTLRSYLETRNARATAAQLVIARNTVFYRLRRARELRGMRLDQR